jgi:hypothetical protein
MLGNHCRPSFDTLALCLATLAGQSQAAPRFGHQWGSIGFNVCRSCQVHGVRSISVLLLQASARLWRWMMTVVN